MCTGGEAALLAASLAATTAGTVQQSRAADRADKAAARRIRDESDRQRRLAEEASSKALDSLAQFAPENFNEKKAQLVDENIQTVGDLINRVPKAESFNVKSAPKVVGKEFARQSKQASDEVGDFAKALATFSSQGQGLGLANLRGMTNQQLINLIGKGQARSLGLLGGELANADKLADTPLGDALVGLGKTGLSTAVGGSLGPKKGAKK